MINKDELIYKLKAVIEYLKNNRNMVMNYIINYVRT